MAQPLFSFEDTFAEETQTQVMIAGAGLGGLIFAILLEHAKIKYSSCQKEALF